MKAPGTSVPESGQLRGRTSGQYAKSDHDLEGFQELAPILRSLSEYIYTGVNSLLQCHMGRDLGARNRLQRLNKPMPQKDPHVFCSAV